MKEPRAGAANTALLNPPDEERTDDHPVRRPTRKRLVAPDARATLPLRCLWLCAPRARAGAGGSRADEGGALSNEGGPRPGIAARLHAPARRSPHPFRPSGRV